MRTVLPDAVSVDGVSVTYGVSGASGPDLLLLHGAGANHMWWHAVAPILEERWRIIAVDLSGHGDSGRREEYRPESWVTEVGAVLDAVGSTSPVIAGHSMGARVGMSVAALTPDRIAGLIVLDTAISLPDRFRTERLAKPEPSMKVYPTRDDILARFRLKPTQPMPPAELSGPVAQFSVRETEAGWGWKHDLRTPHRIEDAFLESISAQITCPVGIVFGAESGLVDRSIIDTTARTLSGHIGTVQIAAAHHHLILDQPAACAAAIDSLASRILDRTD